LIHETLHTGSDQVNDPLPDFAAPLPGKLQGFREPAEFPVIHSCSDGDSGAAGAVDGGSVVGPAANVIKELLYARVGVAGIVRREAAALGEFRVQVLEVLQGLLVQVLIDLNGNQLPACFAQRPRDPDR